MNTKAPIPQLFVGEGSDITVAGIVGFAQEQYRGQHFCKMAVRLNGGWLSFIPCTYQACVEPDKPQPVRFLSVAGERLCIFEHFLHSVRSRYTGLSFNEIYVESNQNWQFVGPKMSPCHW